MMKDRRTPANVVHPNPPGNMLRLGASPLRFAAREFGRLPEVAEARRQLGLADADGALRTLRRAVQVVEAVPMPPLQLAAAGSLAQMLRAKGALSEEMDVWKRAIENAGSTDADLRLHALNGAAACALHRGETDVALDHCEAAETVMSSSPKWRASFGLHRMLSRVQRLRAADSATATLELPGMQQDVDALVHAATLSEAKEPSEPEEAVVRTAASKGAMMLLGDVLSQAGDAAAARACWSELLPIDSATAAPAGASAETPPMVDDWAVATRSGVMLEVAARCRLGRSLLSQGHAADARATLGAAVDLCDAQLPAEDALLANVLGELAMAVADEGDFVAAEGLYRSATSSALSTRAMTAPEAALLLPALWNYAALLRRLETNGRPRVSEAESLESGAAALQERHMEASALGGTWLGLDPWYTYTSSVDWIDECLS